MSERVLHEWTDSESIIRIVEDDRGFFGWSAESGIVTDLISTVFCRELARLAARVAELELDREGRIRSSDYDKALIEELEAENERLRDEVDRQTKAKECYEERQARKEAENAKLRKCVAAADATSLQVGRILSGERWEGDFRLVHADGMLDLDGSDRDYRAARAEVDK